MEYGVQLLRRTDGIECMEVRRFGRGACPETPRRTGLQGVPKRPNRTVQRWANSVSHRYSMTRHPYITATRCHVSRRVGIERAPLSLRRQCLAEGRTLGASF